MVFKPQTFHETSPQAEINNPTDASLEAAVAKALARAGLVDASRIGVTTMGGIVTLDGFVGSHFEVETAGDVARRVDGVTGIDNKLEVQAAVV